MGANYGRQPWVPTKDVSTGTISGATTIAISTQSSSSIPDSSIYRKQVPGAIREHWKYKH
jgi:hypothetical protein